MARVRGKDTSPEMKVRRALFAAGFRYLLHVKHLPGRPDLTLARYRLAIFVHGCFWHGHDCKRSKRPTTNTDFWNEKLDRNLKRDAEKLVELKALGWDTFVIWQCTLQRDLQVLLDRLEDQQSSELTR